MYNIQLSRQYIEPTKIISVTAPKWVIYDFFSMKYIRGYRAHNKCQLGVFSKLLVFCTINTLIKKHKIQPKIFQTIISSNVLKMFPKQQNLKADDIITLEDLLNLMLLDQSQISQVILSSNIGTYLYKKHKNQYYSVYDVNQRPLKQNLKYFYQLVNSYCKLMHLENIKYIESDPILRKQINHCSAADVAKLCIQCLNIPFYNSILKKQQHHIKIKYIDDKGHLTNKLHIVKNKTITQKFIPYINLCRNWEEKQFLSSNCAIKYDDANTQVRPIIVVLLNSYSPKDRQKDIQQIVQWYLKSQNLLTQTEKNVQSLHKKILKTQPVENAEEVLNNKINQKLGLNSKIKSKLLISPISNKEFQNNGSPVKRIRKIFNLKTQQSSIY